MLVLDAPPRQAGCLPSVSVPLREGSGMDLREWGGQRAPLLLLPLTSWPLSGEGVVVAVTVAVVYGVPCTRQQGKPLQ